MVMVIIYNVFKGVLYGADDRSLAGEEGVVT